MSRPSLRLSDEAREAAAAWCIALSDGALAPHDRTRFQAWLDSDPEHPALFERTVVAWMATEDQSSQPAMIKMRSLALEGVHRAERRRWTGWAFGGRNAVALVASVLLMIVAGASWWRYTPVDYETGVGERRTVALADGSAVSIDADTLVRVRYLGDRREIWLDHGRAKFSVAKDPLRPFSVKVGDRLVVATGTQFSVEKLTNDVRIVLYEGHVAVMDTSRPQAQPIAIGPRRVPAEQVLSPGRELIIPNTRRELIGGGDASPTISQSFPRLVAVDAGRSLGWEAGILEFVNEPLNDAVERMNRYGSRPLHVGDATAAATRISGQFEGADTAAFVEGVTAVFPLDATVSASGGIELRQRRSAPSEK